MDPQLAAMFDLAFFHDNGFSRRACTQCGNAFWSLDHDRGDCGDSTCTEYSFLGAPLSSKPLGLAEMREAFLAYWEGKGHSRVPRNPVVARWRDDIYLNIASIANYQPHVTSGDCPPPANPLVVSQPCIRLNDLANIGRSGRHFSCFEMMGHHAFNKDEPGWGEHYWTEECVSGGHEFLVDVLGLDPKSLTYVESEWAGGGNAGPCFEVFAGGLEVATLVFMCLEEADDGAFEIKGTKYAMMDLKIIDTGWGLERLAWASVGTPSAYETVFPDTLDDLRACATVAIADDERSREIVAMHARVQGVLNLDVGMKLDKLRGEVVGRLAEHGIVTDVAELEAIMGPVEGLYALADHLRCLSFMVGDGLVPGNVKAGYLMRLMFRRAFRFARDLGIDTPLSELLADNMQRMTDQFPEFAAAISRAREMADLELQRYEESNARGLRLVERVLAKGTTIDTPQLLELYDTHGLGPNTVADAAAKHGVTVEIPDDFDMLLAERHSQEKKAKAKRIIPAGVPATELLFYSEQDNRRFDGCVVWTRALADLIDEGEHFQSTTAGVQIMRMRAGEGDSQVITDTLVHIPPIYGERHPARDIQLVALDRTAFFHETGGQPSDRGALYVGEERFEVLRSQKDGDRVLHFVVDSQGQIEPGALVRGEVDWTLRMDHTRSHTATHIMNQSVRRVLGPHSWQAGTQKYADCARVDMSHFRRPTAEEVNEIERLANWVVMQGAEVTRTWWQRTEAEAHYGFSLLQGGIPKGTDVRVVEIGVVPRPPVTDQPNNYDAFDWTQPFDTEYCGGTHCHHTSEVGPVKIYRTEKIQDGIERFEYSAGLHAASKWQNDERLLRASASAMSVSPPEAPRAATRFFDEWKERGKLLEEVQQQLAELKARLAGDAAEEVNGIRIIVQDDLDPGAMQQTAAELIGAGKTVALLAAPAGLQVRLLFARSDDVDVNMGNVLREAAAVMGGKGGGRPDFAQGAGPDAGKLGEAMGKAREVALAALG